MLCRDILPEIAIKESGMGHELLYCSAELHQPYLFSFKSIVSLNTSQYITMQVFTPLLFIKIQLLTDFDTPRTSLLNSYKSAVLKQALMDPGE